MAVERNRLFIFCIDDDRVAGDVGIKNALQRVANQCSAQSLALVAIVNRQPANASNGHIGIARQLLLNRWREVGKRNAAGRQRVEPTDLIGFVVDGQKARAEPPALLGSRSFGQVFVEHFGTAVKRRTVVPFL